VKRALTPTLNPTGLGSAAAAIYAAVVMIWNATHHHAVIDPQVIVAAIGAAAFLYTRFKVTPVADPKDGNGVPLKPVAPPAAQGPSALARLPEVERVDTVLVHPARDTPLPAVEPHDVAFAESGDGGTDGRRIDL